MHKTSSFAASATAPAFTGMHEQSTLRDFDHTKIVICTVESTMHCPYTVYAIVES